MQVPTLCERTFYKIGRYNFQLPWVLAQQNNLTAVVNNLRRIDTRRTGQMSETRRIERHRKHGFGSAVLKEAMAHARSAGCYKVMLMTTGSQRAETLRFYENNGFVRGGKTGFVAHQELKNDV